MASVPQPSIANSRQDLYRRVEKHNFAPLWEVYHSLIPNEPVTPCKPALWRYRDARPYLMEAGTLITAKEATRRVLILQNPGMQGKSSITQSLFAGLQLITYNPFLYREGEPRPQYRSTPKPLISPVFPHPLVRTHPNSGKKILYLDASTEVEVWVARFGSPERRRSRCRKRRTTSSSVGS